MFCISNKTPTFFRNLLFSLSAGILIGSGFVLPIFWPAAFLGVSFFLSLLQKTRSLWKLCIYGYIVGCSIYLCALCGIALGAYPLDWFGINEPLYQVVALGVSWIGASLVLGLPLGVCAVAIKVFQTDRWFDLFLIPSLWVFCEWCTSIVFYIAFLGPGSFFGPHFTLGWIGYLLATDVVFLQGAQIGGVYFLSFILVAVCVLFLRYSASKEVLVKKRYALTLVSVFCLWFVLHMAGLIVEDDFINDIHIQEISVAVMSRYMPPTIVQSEAFQHERYRELLDLVHPYTNIDMLVLPENATFLRMLLHSDTPQDDFKVLQHAGSSGKMPVIVDSEDILERDGFLYSRASFFNGESRIISHKQFLLPLGEYVPYIYRVGLQFFVPTSIREEILRDRNYVPSDIVSNAFVKGSMVAVRFCDEVMSPELYRRHVADGANMLVNMSSQSWFHGSPVVYEQMKRIAKVRAVESGRWYVQSGNMAPAFAIDAHGVVRYETEKGSLEIMNIQVPQYTNVTFYTHFGQYIVYLLLVVIGIRLLQVVYAHNFK